MNIMSTIEYYFIENPFVSILLLVLACIIFRVVDIFALRLDEPPVNEALFCYFYICELLIQVSRKSVSILNIYLQIYLLA